MAQTTQKKDTNKSVEKEEPKNGNAVKFGSVNVSKKMVVILTTLAVIVLGFLGFKYLYQNPKEEKAQTMLTQNLELLNANRMQQLEQILTQVAQAEAMLESEMLKGDSANLSLKDTLNNRVEAFKAARQEIYNKALKGDGKLPGLLKIADEGMTAAANIAKAEAGICYYKLGNYKEAIKYLESFTPQGDKGLSPQYVAALANCYAADGQIDKAIETFKEAAKEADNDATSPDYLMEAALLLENQNKKEEALKIYEQIKAEYPRSQIVQPQSVGGAYVSQIDKYIERVSK